MCTKCINMYNICAQAYSHLTINPNHLCLLVELPSNLKILLLQHTRQVLGNHRRLLRGGQLIIMAQTGANGMASNTWKPCV